MPAVVGPCSPGDGEGGQCRNAGLEAQRGFAARCWVMDGPWSRLHPWHPPLVPHHPNDNPGPPCNTPYGTEAVSGDCAGRAERWARATREQGQGQKQESRVKQDTEGTQRQLYFRGVQQRRSLQHGGQDPVVAPEGSGLQSPYGTPLASQLDGHEDACTEAKRFWGNYPARKASQEGERQAALTAAWQGEVPGCRPAEPSSCRLSRSPRQEPFLWPFFVLMSEARPRGDRAGASPLPAVPSHQISTGIFMTQKGPAFYLPPAEADSLGTC